MLYTQNVEIGKRKLSLESGELAKQADGAVVVRYGDTIVLVSAVAEKERKEDTYFFPLTVNYVEQTYAAGKIPGGFFKREGRPREKEVLSSRLIDRPHRPLFPENFMNETQIIALVLSADQENDSDILGINGASAALTISEIPFNGPIGAVRVGNVNGEFIVNPTFSQLEDSRMDLIVVSRSDSIVMLEGACFEVTEDEILKAIEIAIGEIKKIIAVQEKLREDAGKEKMEVSSPDIPQKILDRVRNQAEIEVINRIKDKSEREIVLKNLEESICKDIEEEFPESQNIVRDIIEKIRREDMRKKILGESCLRIDGRGSKEIRPINCEAGMLPRVHGSAVFTRGQTQSQCTVTLGTTTDQQKVDDLEGESVKTFMLHYNFFPFSVGETRYLRGPSRREIGHGILAERALGCVLPVEEQFPYTIRIVSDILESNGSSSMATVCGSSLALMDAGVPIRTSVAGIAIGLVKEGDKFVLLSDIIGEEDHFGDMDFKVTGTRKGVTALQLDTKTSGLSLDIIEKALLQAKEGRYYILDVMDKTLDHPRESLSDYAPKIIMMTVPKDKIGEIIGPGGKTIRGLIEETGAEIEISDDGKVSIISSELDSVQNAKKKIKALIQEVNVGDVFEGKVIKITNFGAFVEIVPGKEGLVHISQLSHKRVGKVEDVLNVGDVVKVVVKEIDNLGRINLSRKVLLPSPKSSHQGKQNYHGKYKKKQSGKRNNSNNRKD